MITDGPAATPLSLPPAGPESSPAPRPLTRRELVIGAAASAALLATNSITGAVTHSLSTRAADARAQRQLEATRTELEAEITLLKKQLAIYDELERVGLDQLIREILQTYDRLWPAAQAGLGLLRSGLGTVEDALSRFESMLLGLQRTVDSIAGLHAGVDAQLSAVQGIINEVLKRTAPIGEAVSGFMGWLLSRIPFGVGDRAREASERLGTLVANIPILTGDTRERLLQPLQQEWLGTDQQGGIRGRLFDPLRRGLIAPLREHLAQMQAMGNHWQGTASKPLADALAARERLRQELAQLQADTRGADLRHREG